MKTRKWDGKSIKMPGVISGMPLEKYHAADACYEPSISSSGLRTIFNKSPKHYWCSSPYNPNRIEPEETEALVLGRAAHHLLFGEADFRRSFAIRPATINGESWHGSKTICKAWLNQAEESGLTVLTPSQLEQIKGMAISLAEEPLVQAGILNGSIETSWFTKHTPTGVWIKSRPDASPNDSLDMVDLKTTNSTEVGDIQQAIFKHGYYIQAGLMALIAKELLGQSLTSFTLVFVEKTPPYDTAIFTLKDADIARGIQAAEKSIRIFADCMETGKWPGRSSSLTDAQYIEMREYAQKEIDYQLTK